MRERGAADSKTFALAARDLSRKSNFVKNEELAARFAELSTPLVFDAALRLKIPFRVAPSGIAPVIPGTRAAGRVLPAKHFGSVAVFLEALEPAEGGAISR